MSLFSIFVRMKWIWLVGLSLLAGCSETKLCRIEGEIPGTVYEGEQIYLVPLQGATQETVDSAFVVNGQFRFEKQNEQAQMYILRTRPQLRLEVQELLVVIEPGELKVRLDSMSVARGTPLNKSLQQWKEQKQEWDATLHWLNSLLPSATEEQKEEVLHHKEELKRKSSIYNYTFVKENKDNVIGAFVFSMIKGSLSPEQIETLGMSQ